MNFAEFQKLIQEDEKNELAQRRFVLVLDYEDFKVYDDKDNYHAWYCNEAKQEVVRVGLVGALTFKNNAEPRTAPKDFDNPLDYWSIFIKSFCCGIEKGGNTLYWFDVMDDDDDE
jgi:hypothetical protein